MSTTYVGICTAFSVRHIHRSGIAKSWGWYGELSKESPKCFWWWQHCCVVPSEMQDPSNFPILMALISWWWWWSPWWGIKWCYCNFVCILIIRKMPNIWLGFFLKKKSKFLLENISFVFKWYPPLTAGMGELLFNTLINLGRQWCHRTPKLQTSAAASALRWRPYLTLPGSFWDSGCSLAISTSLKSTHPV